MSNHLVNIEGDQIVIRVPISALDHCVKFMSDNGDGPKLKVTDSAMFAKDLANELTREEENGETRVTRMLDKAMAYAIDQGAEGVEDV